MNAKESLSFKLLIEGKEKLMQAQKIAEQIRLRNDMEYTVYCLELNNAIHYCNSALNSYKLKLDEEILADMKFLERQAMLEKEHNTN